MLLNIQDFAQNQREHQELLSELPENKFSGF